MRARHRLLALALALCQRPARPQAAGDWDDVFSHMKAAAAGVVATNTTVAPGTTFLRALSEPPTHSPTTPPPTHAPTRRVTPAPTHTTATPTPAPTRERAPRRVAVLLAGRASTFASPRVHGPMRQHLLGGLQRTDREVHVFAHLALGANTDANYAGAVAHALKSMGPAPKVLVKSEVANAAALARIKRHIAGLAACHKCRTTQQPTDAILEAVWSVQRCFQLMLRHLATLNGGGAAGGAASGGGTGVAAHLVYDWIVTVHPDVLFLGPVVRPSAVGRACRPGFYPLPAPTGVGPRHRRGGAEEGALHVRPVARRRRPRA